MGDSDQEDHDHDHDQNHAHGHGEDSGFVSMSMAAVDGEALSLSSVSSSVLSRTTRHQRSGMSNATTQLSQSHPHNSKLPNYKLLFLTHLLLQNRFIHSSYRLSLLQTRETPGHGHGNMIYCLQLYTYPSSYSSSAPHYSPSRYAGRQVLFTGSRDQTVREWDLETRQVVRVIDGVHVSSVLSICVHRGFLASAGSDQRVAVWDLESDKLVKVIADHEDSVLCVRFDDERLVTCSKGGLCFSLSVL
jgi:F-box and WD-40 domain protein 1/11